jgi:hypothetical protein
MTDFHMYCNQGWEDSQVVFSGEKMNSVVKAGIRRRRRIRLTVTLGQRTTPGSSCRLPAWSTP